MFPVTLAAAVFTFGGLVGPTAFPGEHFKVAPGHEVVEMVRDGGMNSYVHIYRCEEVHAPNQGWEPSYRQQAERYEAETELLRANSEYFRNAAVPVVRNDPGLVGFHQTWMDVDTIVINNRP